MKKTMAQFYACLSPTQSDERQMQYEQYRSSVAGGVEALQAQTCRAARLFDFCVLVG